MFDAIPSMHRGVPGHRNTKNAFVSPPLIVQGALRSVLGRRVPEHKVNL